MAVLVYIEGQNGQIKSSSIEAVYYGLQVGQKIGATVQGIIFGPTKELGISQLKSVGLSNLIQVVQDETDVFQKANTIQKAIEKYDIQVVITSKSTECDSILGIVSAKNKVSAITNVVCIPEIEGNTFTLKRSIYTGKSFAYTQVSTALKLISIRKNAIEVSQNPVEMAIEKMEVSSASASQKVQFKETEKQSGAVSLPEANIVVSAGRGMKGPENWGIVEDLANVLGAATACSKPVSDLDWRPHHEHVGQTGVKVSPNLYIACGISGAIQHLAGVNSSKVIVVINKDPEAPFFKAADYGIVGDVFEVLPRLTAKFKSS